MSRSGMSPTERTKVSSSTLFDSRRVPLQIHEVLAEPVAPLEEDALLEQDLDVLVLLPEHVFERLAAVGRVAEEERPVAQIVEDGRRLGIEQRQTPGRGSGA